MYVCVYVCMSNLSQVMKLDLFSGFPASNTDWDIGYLDRLFHCLPQSLLANARTATDISHFRNIVPNSVLTHHHKMQSTPSDLSKM
jgi:hypothetical protein